MILPNPRNCTLLFHSSSLSIMVGNRHTAKKKSIRKQWRSFEKLWTSSTPTWQAPTQFACPVAVVLIALHTKHVKLHLQVCYRLFGCPLCDFKDFAEVLFVRMWRPLLVYFCEVHLNFFRKLTWYLRKVQFVWEVQFSQNNLVLTFMGKFNKSMIKDHFSVVCVQLGCLNKFNSSNTWSSFLLICEVHFS
jgi:hypothetical protein